MGAQGRVMLFQLGEAPEPVRQRHGTYVEWFERAWDGPLTVVDGRSAAYRPHHLRPRDFAAIIVSGSPSSLAEPEPWMDDALALVRRAHEDGTPLLGVCFGHQLIGRAFGGTVVENPRGWEVGTCAVHLHEAARQDPLFSGLETTLSVNLTHRDMVALPADHAGPLRVLAHNEATPIQALAAGEHIRGVQFHPEITGAVAQAYIEARRTFLADRNPDALIARTTDCPDGVAVMRNFRRHFVDRA